MDGLKKGIKAMKKISRRELLETTVKTAAASAVPWPFLIQGKNGKARPKVIIISIDSLDPAILELNSRGEPGGKPGDWLMPNLRSFLARSTWFGNTRDFLPSATDMNHLNAMAGTSSGQTGILGVFLQFYNWKPDGKALLTTTSLKYARDDRGRKVDTLFKAWKRKWPRSKTMFASGKHWVIDMFLERGCGIDHVLHGMKYPYYISKPRPYSFYDPPTDRNRFFDEESVLQKLLCDLAFYSNPEIAPCDKWIVDSSLKMLSREKPDLAYIILAEMDDSQHGLGTVTRPGDFHYERRGLRRVLVDKYNNMVFKEAVVDAMRDVDVHFGRLIRGLRRIPYYRDAYIVLYSDHGHVTHKDTLLSNFYPGIDTDIRELLFRKGLIGWPGKFGYGNIAYSGSAMAYVYQAGKTYKERVEWAEKAKAVLRAHRIWDRFDKKFVSPWYVCGREEMMKGLPGVLAPGELCNPYFFTNNSRGKLLWPDLAIFMKDGWQAPVYSGMLSNLGVKLPPNLPPVKILIGGHGSHETKEVVMAIKGPGIKPKYIQDKKFSRNHRIADIAVTLSSLLGLKLTSTTIGKDRTGDLS